ncbi:MAG: hypothetical protein A3G33_00605 [Omnitrophica bacterium RIFCSPLOWO2_12_FULL_44_17]|uniref:Multifunctional fusion protein n=1 Tax=Candidatus Danuiimicrobium aquiferis TaxID=1801832 RepID=A0A1G1L355_9BACT|nr:MAG: hypothetical protein A3E74_07840 [Omnitrophica bacterium RIFCSPHIGHO2_12_FULL_44_12]OGW99309.1 MAG: hypothetical protein A3G33_00605 [Omnitrophica bacterium RIFCSPLOWO2_12_FULL_44_17]OGX04906.1 MAG: hypothetical protein A3J12_04465 [Omnitrophica bacterium RIFCSPLOWO2_02_FULL_44_11]
MTHDKQKSKLQCGLPLNEAELKKILTPEQYKIMRDNGTEAPFLNAYWNNKKPGIYVDLVSGKPLFSSVDKFDSGTGWPSFTKPIVPKNIVEKPDISQKMMRIEIRSKESNSHLGHVFSDGPKPTGMRYCINSAALQFIPEEDLEKEGYGEYLSLFGKKAKVAQTVFGPTKTQTAVFGAGCFWGVESAFREVSGVVNTTVGFMGGITKNPTYKEICTGTTGHAEVVQIEYDPGKISYEKLLEAFWQIHNPTTLNRQGPDVGEQYRSVIFYENSEQKKAAEQLKEKLNKAEEWKNKIVTAVEPKKEFYPAEEYHQRYCEKNHMKPMCHFPARN